MLREIVTIRKGSAIKNIANVPFEGAKRFIQIDDLRNDNTLKYTAEKGTEVSERDILIAWDGANAGTIGYGKSGIIGSTIAALRITDSVVTTSYLGRFLKTQFKYLQDNCSGATIPHLRRDILENIAIPIPNHLCEQELVVNILDRAESIVANRQRTIKLSDELIRAVFYEMFGDPVTNTKQWNIRTIRDCVVKTQNENPTTFSKKVYTYVDISSVDNNTKSITAIQNIVGANAPSRARKLAFQGDVIISTVRPNLNAVAIVEETYPNLIVSTGFCVLRPKEEIIDKYYLFMALRSQQFIDKMTTLAKGASYPAISDNDVLDFEINVPSILMQKKYATLVQELITFRKDMNAHLKQSSNLFKSLLSQFFK